MTGRVAVLEYGGEFELREYPVPDPEPGAVLVRLTRAGVYGSDLHVWRGEMPWPGLAFLGRTCGASPSSGSSRTWSRMQRGGDGLRLSRAALSMTD